jgi:SDR family mycofactocin-dependent oxidoreductase
MRYAPTIRGPKASAAAELFASPAHSRECHTPRRLRVSMPTGPLSGQVALVTGAARGQGRAHAIGLARDGADVVICDIDDDITTVPYPLSRSGDLKETADLVAATGRNCLSAVCDVRESAAVDGLVERAIDRFGKLDIVVANAGIASFGRVQDLTDDLWNDVISVNLTGTFHTMRAALPHMVSRKYGRIVATASMAARGGTPNAAHYVASKWGVIGLVKSLAREVASDGITVNAVCPANVDTMMIQNKPTYQLFRPDLENPSQADVIDNFINFHQIPVPWVPPEAITDAIRYIVAPSTKYMTGSTVDVACGNTALIP